MLTTETVLDMKLMIELAWVDRGKQGYRLVRTGNGDCVGHVVDDQSGRNENIGKQRG